ncbi:hypothetical protein LCGC14_1403060 [marine sediment metagenome]|uniref:Uncharacterized protein n=1 Tax=marine sediment metagenome TaxID=412755 RepID=A0A0F9KHE8_9ZZZZ
MIKVQVENEILGNSVFWEGPENEIDKIWNIPARMLAERVVKDGKTRKSGMWKVSQIKEKTP